MSDTADWQFLWFAILGAVCLVGAFFAWLEKRDTRVIPYKRVNECKPGCFQVGRDCK